ncbi:MAG TPA: acyl-ACP thioesterase domain-containing protein [Acidimicrobiales bacterium]|nr:acyl-ACP thioesterase domain-containing protein [Acidimicrobiales bacterium]
MPAGAAVEALVPMPENGRRFSATREVRLADASRNGRLRLDAVARYLQDVANDDARDALGAGDAAPWVVRRTVVDVSSWPRFQEQLVLTTFCGGTGPRWAERRTTLAGRDGGLVEAASLWVHIDMTTGRPAPLPASFIEHFGGACGGRRVSGRLAHPPPPPSAERRPWMLRRTDFDVMGHLNNAAYWAVVEEVLVGPAPSRFELEYRTPIEPGDEVELLVGDGAVWLAGPAGVYASARVTPA